MDRDSVVNAFLQRYAADWAGEGPRPLVDYLAEWPEHRELIEEQYALLRGTQDATVEGDQMRLGPYRLDRLLGRGGQGEVWLARDESLDRAVALKVLRGLDRVSAREIERLQREAILASRLDHAGICPIYQAGTVEGTTYIAMRYVEGASLAQIIRQARVGARDGLPLPVGPRRAAELVSILTFFERAAEALAHAHDRGVLHRDVKPGNLFVAEDAKPVLLDFGLAQALEGDPESTGSRSLSGTPAYIAPEQLSLPTGVHDPRMDVYSLGVSLYEALTLTRPFEAPTREGLFREILTGEVPRLRPACPVASRDLETVVQTAMARSRDRRYRNARALADDLGRAAKGEPIVARKVSSPERFLRHLKRHPAHATIVALLVLLTGLGTGLVAWWPTYQRGKQADREARIEEELVTGYLEVAEGDAERAQLAFQAALALDSGAEYAVYGMCLACIEQGEASAAEASLEGAPIPRRGRARLAEMIALLREGPAAVADGAPGELETVSEKFLDGALLLARGHKGLFSEFPRAVDALVAAILDPAPDLPWHYLLLADALSHAPRPRWNEQVVQIIGRRWGDRARAQELMGMALAPIDRDRATEHFERALQIEPRLRIATRLASLWAPVPSRHEAVRNWIAVARDLAGSEPESALVERDVGRALERMGDRHGALDAFAAAHERSPIPTAATWDAARLIEQSEGMEAAIAFLEAAVAKRPRDPVALSALARRRLAEYRWEEFRELSLRAVEENPWYGDALVNAGLAHAAAGEHESALACYRVMQRAFARPARWRAKASLRARLQAGEFATSLPELDALAAEGDGWAAAARRLARAIQNDELPAKPAWGAEVEARRAEDRGDLEAAVTAWRRLAQTDAAPITVIGPAPIHAFLCEMDLAAQASDETRAAQALSRVAKWLDAFERAVSERPELERPWIESRYRLRYDPRLALWRSGDAPVKSNETRDQLARLFERLRATD